MGNRTRPPRCYLCRKRDHKSRDCPQRSQSPSVKHQQPPPPSLPILKASRAKDEDLIVFEESDLEGQDKLKEGGAGGVVNDIADIDGIDEITRHLQFFPASARLNDSATLRQKHSFMTTPIFSSQVKDFMKFADDPTSGVLFTKYGLLGCRSRSHNGDECTIHTDAGENLIYANTSAPWSAFICGQQGAGKSYTLSCLLENALLEGRRLGKNDKALSGILFHYDKDASDNAAQVCEAAYLCSQGVEVHVFTMPSNFKTMQEAYHLPGVPAEWQPKVKPLLLADSSLKADHMLTLMAATSNDLPLYMTAIKKIIRTMKTEGEPFTMDAFEARIEKLELSNQQKQPLDLRMDILKSVLHSNVSRTTSTLAGEEAASFENPGLTVVDLSCSTVTESDVCSLYQICLSMFLASRHSNAQTPEKKQSLIIAIDEAHKFLTDTPEANAFSEELIRLIREQRHLSCRVVIATQEPTISPTLMDLCDVSVIHRFNSPAWFHAIKGHLAGMMWSGGLDSGSGKAAFKSIVTLQDGEALLFCPKAYLDAPAARTTLPDNKGDNLGRTDDSALSEDSADDDGGGAALASSQQLDGGSGVSSTSKSPQTLMPLGTGYIKLRIRTRVTADGGKSQMAD